MAVEAENTNNRVPSYTVMVYRENLVKSDDPSLNDAAGLALTVSPANNVAVSGFTYTDTDTKSYDVEVEYIVDAVTVEANTAQPGAVAVITPSDQDSLTPMHQVLLGAGAETTIMIEVTAEDGITTDTYSITIYRPRRVMSSDADLSALSLSGVTLSSSFVSDKASYIGRALYSTDKTTVSYTADVGATVGITADPDTIGGDPTVTTEAGITTVALAAGIVTTITVAVEAENTNNRVPSYTVMVYRENFTAVRQRRFGFGYRGGWWSDVK